MTPSRNKKYFQRAEELTRAHHGHNTSQLPQQSVNSDPLTVLAYVSAECHTDLFNTNLLLCQAETVYACCYHRNSRTRMRTLSRDLTHQWGIIMADNDWQKATGSATRN